LGLVEGIFAAGKRIQAFGEDLLKRIPEVLRPEALGRESPSRIQNGAAIPGGTSVFGPGSQMRWIAANST